MKVRSMRGREVDMGALLARNETSVAVGNASMNARGDIVGPGGNVIKSRDEIAQEYHRNNPKAVRTVAITDVAKEIMAPAPVPETRAKTSDATNVEFSSPADAVAALREQAKKPARKIEDTDS